ncbi:MAG: hypothetical protein FJ294_04575 [Planctomycetes bacterium]|nr:hypothetical protein [Planctomycetota bacterium]
MSTSHAHPLRRALRALAVMALPWASSCSPSEPATESSPPRTSGNAALDATAPDRFRPDFDPRRDALPAPRRGGKVVIHVETLPRQLNYLLDNSGVTRRILQELHGTLLERDLFTGVHRPLLADSWVVEDTLVLRDERRLYGELVEQGERWLVVPRSTPSHELSAAVEVPKADVARIERGTVYTFRLRSGIHWHDGAPLRPEDFLLTWRLARIPQVRCDEKRFEFEHIVHAEKLDERSLRFFYDRQYFGAAAVFGALTPLPTHIYDLRAPQHPNARPEATDEELARYVNEHPANRNWIGVGPYRLVEFSDEYVEAERVDMGWPSQDAGWFDSIRWRLITDDALAYRALCAGEIDFTTRLLSDDFFRASSDPEFTSRAYVGHFYTPRASYIGWNLRRAQLADARVRTALALATDWDGLVQSFYRGLAQRVTAEWFDGGLDYDRELEPLPFDVQRARALLAEAGWYDRDGDGFVDRDGKPLSIEILTQAGSRAGEVFLQRYQETLAQAGVRLDIGAVAWPVLIERVREREFDGVYKVWVVPIQSDPAQRWHSREVGTGSANETSFSAPDVDRLIEVSASELDDARRGAMCRELQRRLYAEQAYNYGVKVPHRFGASLRLRNVRVGPVDPGFRVREWYFVD